MKSVFFKVTIIIMSLLWLLCQQLVSSCNDGARRMERTEQMYTIQKQMDFGKIKVRADYTVCFRTNTFKEEWCRSSADENTQTQFCRPGLLTLVPSQPFPLVSSSRWLKKRGELAVCTEELSIWRAFSTRSYYLFLFNDVLIVTKKKRSVGLKHTVFILSMILTDAWH